MLDLHVQIVDVDVDHWAYLQSKLAKSGKEKERIIVIHERGSILKYIHSHGKPIRKVVDKITNPFKDVEKIYEANKDLVEYVIIIDRDAVNDYFAEVQKSWSPDESIVEYTIKMRKLLNKYYEKGAIVTYPGKPTNYLGWIPTLNIDYSTILEFVNSYLLPNSLVALFVFSGKKLKASLILGFNKIMKIDLITSTDVLRPLKIEEYDWKHYYKDLISVIENKLGKKCSLGIFIEEKVLDGIIQKGSVDLQIIIDAMKQNNIILYPITDKLKTLISKIIP
jgi:hypothetical protein